MAMPEEAISAASDNLPVQQPPPASQPNDEISPEAVLATRSRSPSQFAIRQEVADSAETAPDQSGHSGQRGGLPAPLEEDSSDSKGEPGVQYTPQTSTDTTDQHPKSPHDVRLDRFTNELRHVPKLIEEGLLVRTHWRQEQQNLEYSRKYHLESIKKLMSALGAEMAAFQQWKDTAKSEAITKLQPVPDDSQQAQPESEPLDMSKVEQHVDPDHAGPVGGRTEQLAELDAEVKRQYEQYLKDYDTVLEKEGKIKDLTDEIVNSDYRIQRKLESLRERMKARQFAAELRSEMLDENQTISDSRESHRSGASTPPLVRVLFDRMGDIGIFRDRLDDLNFTYAEGLVEREFLRDRGEDLPVTDEEFHYNYQIRREQIEAELSAAERDAEALRIECIASGIDPNAHRAPKPSMYSGSHAESVRSGSQSEASLPVVQVRELRLQPLPHQARQTLPSRIDNWLLQSSFPADDPLPEDIPDSADSPLDSIAVGVSAERELAETAHVDAPEASTSRSIDRSQDNAQALGSDARVEAPHADIGGHDISISDISPPEIDISGGGGHDISLPDISPSGIDIYGGGPRQTPPEQPGEGSAGDTAIAERQVSSEAVHDARPADNTEPLSEEQHREESSLSEADKDPD